MSNRRGVVIRVTMAPIVLLAAIVSRCPGDDPPSSTALETEVRRVLVDLEAPTRAVRNAAANRLLELGPQALPFLPPPELLATVSVRESVGRIRHELERRHARASTQASRVNLAGTKSLQERLAEIALQTGNRIESSQLPVALLDRLLTFDGLSREFWPVLDDLATRGGFTIGGGGSSRGLVLSPPSDPGDESSAVVCYAGPFRVSALPVAIVPISEDREPATPARRKRLARVVVSVQAEPRLRPLYLQYAMADIGAFSMNAGKLPAFSPEASYELAVSEPGGKSLIQLDFVLPPSESPEKLALKGKLRMTVAADSAAIRFADIVQLTAGKPIGIDRRRGGVTVTLERVRREKRGATTEVRVQVTVAYDSGGPAFESHRTWMLHNDVFLETAGRARLPLNGGFERTLEADGAVGMEYRFVDLPDPLPELAFVYVAPTLIVDVPVAFDLESIPLKPAGARR